MYGIVSYVTVEYYGWVESNHKKNDKEQEEKPDI